MRGSRATAERSLASFRLVVTDARQREAWDPASWSPRTGLIVFVVSAVVLGVGISQAVLLFGRDERPGRAAFVVFWGLIILVSCLFALLCARLSSTAFRGAAVIPRRAGESQHEAEERADKQAWAFGVAIIALTGLLCFAFIVWQAVRHY